MLAFFIELSKDFLIFDSSLRHTKCMVIINNLTVWFKPTVSNDYLSVCMIAACAIPI